jgi:lysine-ketoglutarate reductase/saccharopine dehydrogenase-like protein (TIGR00300 family)
MFSQQIELRGHIIDSLILPKVLDQILASGATYKIEEIRIGRERTDTSYARIAVSAATPAAVDEAVKKLRPHGAELIRDEEVCLAPAPADGVFPPDFYVTSNQPTFVHHGGQWLEVQPVIMDSGIAVDPAAPSALAVKFCDVRQGMLIATGHRGLRVSPAGRGTERLNEFEFMASNVSTEKPKSAVIRALAQEMRTARESRGRILVVPGPAVVHTGAGEHLEQLIQQGYVQLLFSGNALAAHDIEQALYGTSLGVYLREGTLAREGHENHMRAINTIRAAGGIEAAVRAGLLTRGIMCRCVQNRVGFVLAGSIRDDGPLPEVITDVIQAQKAMRARLEGVSLALMLGTMLHSIAVGNLLPASVKTACVDINPGVVTKLADRGTFHALGLVTDLEPFLRELTEALNQD